MESLYSRRTVTQGRAPITVSPAQPDPHRAHRSPARLVLWLILASGIVRLIVAASTGLGVDESYMVALGRQIRLGYFDHPPLAWWITWAATHLLGSEAPWAVRLPFVLLFAGTTWLMYRFAAKLFGERAGLWAAGLLNLAPVLGVTSATWVLPDGPLLAALLGAALCLLRALDARGPRATRWWLAAGICAGLALLSKYSAILVIGGAALFLLTTPARRHWLARLQPYLAAILAAALFLPVIVWNLDNHWASFAFQGGRATGAEWHPGRPFIVFGGEALYLLPWIWVLLVAMMIAAFRRGPGDEKSWLAAWLGVIPALLFALVAAWSPHRIFFHWAAPGYMMLMPLGGDWLARRAGRRWLRWAVTATVSLVVLLLAIFTTEMRFNYAPALLSEHWLHAHPVADGVDWVDLRSALAERGLLGRDRFVAATRWHFAGKIDYALGGEATVVCLDQDDREYGIAHPLAAMTGHDAVIVDPQLGLAQIQALYGKEFRSIEALPPVTLTHGGRPMMTLQLFQGHGFHSLTP